MKKLIFKNYKCQVNNLHMNQQSNKENICQLKTSQVDHNMVKKFTSSSPESVILEEEDVQKKALPACASSVPQKNKIKMYNQQEEIFSKRKQVKEITAETPSPQKIEKISRLTSDADFSKKIQIKFKASRDDLFEEKVPSILYTLTWKHKYDLKLICTKEENGGKGIFGDFSETELKNLIKMKLVYADRDEEPRYDRKNVRKRRPNEKKRKRKQSKPKDMETIEISSVIKESEESIVVRFGINRTYCSKRFGYSPFRLKIDFMGVGKSVKFCTLTSEFRTFAKKLNEDTIKNVNAILVKNKRPVLVNQKGTKKGAKRKLDEFEEDEESKKLCEKRGKRVKKQINYSEDDISSEESIDGNEYLENINEDIIKEPYQSKDESLNDGMLLWNCILSMKQRALVKN